MRHPFRILLLSLACSAALAAQAQTVPADVPAGELSTALDTLARQTGSQFVYRADQLKGVRTRGSHGAATSRQALDQLLQGTGWRAKHDPSGAVVIVRADASAPAPKPVQTPAAAAEPAPTELQTLQVTGSRIPRAQVEGPAPITVLNAEQIRASGFTSVPDVLRSLSQNGGNVQGQQNTTGAQSTPGAQAVDLRGLGPNHTLVLVNGRRVADFPLPLNGRSNFTDVGNIPLGMIERVEVLTGSASAVYGSDAMAGVINFILKKSADGTTLDYRYGDTGRGGGQSQHFTLTSGFDKGGFTGIVGLELLDKKPLWGTDRGIQDSTLDAPTATRRLPRLVAQIHDVDDGVNLAPDGDCAGLAGLNGGTTALAEDPDGNPYCGSTRAIAYRTIENQRKGANAYGSFEYRFSDTLSWFADVQLGRQTVKLLSGTNGNLATSDQMGWEFQDYASAESDVFYNAASGHYESWSRQFAPEETGGLRKRMNETTQKTLSATTGLKGNFGDNWDWEAAYNHSQYKATVKMPRINAAAANAFFLGDLQGYDGDGYAIYSPDPARLYTALTPAQFATIAATSTFRPKAGNDNLSFTADTPALFTLPAGDAGFAGTVEIGNQYYRINPDPLALTQAYYGARYGDGHGSRDHWGAAGELRLPLLSNLQASAAGRYDRYRYDGGNPGRFTYSLGLEWRPLDTLLVRGSYGTGFRAPDMHYLFAGNDYYRATQTDYYTCRSENPGAGNGGCYDWDYGNYDQSTIDEYVGNRKLKVETSKSFTAGLVWSPLSGLDLSVDYYKIRVDNQVQVQDRDQLLITEADCRLGVTAAGASVNGSSPTCADAIARVIRDADGNVTSVHFGPINIAREQTSGIDVSANYRLQTAGAGNFRFGGNYTWVHRHTRQLHPGDATEDMLAVTFSDATLPRVKSNLTAGWDKGPWAATVYGNYLGRLANYDNDGWTRATWRFNASTSYDITDHLRVSLAVDNLFDKMPPRDATWANYPYYDTSWFDSIGRSYYLQFTWKLGGKAL